MSANYSSDEFYLRILRNLEKGLGKDDVEDLIKWLTMIESNAVAVDPRAIINIQSLRTLDPSRRVYLLRAAQNRQVRILSEEIEQLKRSQGPIKSGPSSSGALRPFHPYAMSHDSSLLSPLFNPAPPPKLQAPPPTPSENQGLSWYLAQLQELSSNLQQQQHRLMNQSGPAQAMPQSPLLNPLLALPPSSHINLPSTYPNSGQLNASLNPPPFSPMLFDYPIVRNTLSTPITQEGIVEEAPERIPPVIPASSGMSSVRFEEICVGPEQIENINTRHLPIQNGPEDTSSLELQNMIAKCDHVFETFKNQIWPRARSMFTFEEAYDLVMNLCRASISLGEFEEVISERVKSHLGEHFAEASRMTPPEDDPETCEDVAEVNVPNQDPQNPVEPQQPPISMEWCIENLEMALTKSPNSLYPAEREDRFKLGALMMRHLKANPEEAKKFIADEILKTHRNIENVYSTIQEEFPECEIARSHTPTQSPIKNDRIPSPNDLRYEVSGPRFDQSKRDSEGDFDKKALTHQYALHYLTSSEVPIGPHRERIPTDYFLEACEKVYELENVAQCDCHHGK